MGLEYDLSRAIEIKELRGLRFERAIEIKELQELRLELSPRSQCRNYVQKNGGKAELIKKEEFDAHYRKEEFSDGPYKDSFGDGYGETYNPNRQAFGKLKSGLVIYCELSKDYCKKTQMLLERITRHGSD